MKQKLALFDFCETLIQFQTADRFIDFVRYRERKKRMIRIELFRKFLVKFKFFAVLGRLIKENNYHKRLKLYQLKGVKRNQIETLAESYYKEVIKPNNISKILELMKSYKEKGYEVVIVSGGYQNYINFFAKDYGIEKVIATRINFQNNICLGTIKGLDCLNQNKILKIKEKINLSKYDLENSIAFSDSVTDLPLLKLVGQGMVVSKMKAQIWAKKNRMDEIIWQ